MAGVAATGLALRSLPNDHAGARLEARKVPAALRAFWVDGFLSSAQDAFILAYLPLLAHALGASAMQIGILSASQALGSMLALYPGAIAARRASSLRWIVVLYAGIVGRLLLLLMALTVAINQGQLALYVIIALVTARAFLANFVVPAWTSLAADIIPNAMRARYFASRNFAGSVALLTFTPFGGLLLDSWGLPGGYVVALCVSFILGMGATLAYQRIPEPPARTLDERPPMHFRRVFSNPRFRMFMLATFALQFTTMIAGPFFTVYLDTGLGASNFQIGWLTTASALAGLCGQLIFGDVMARRGSLWLSRVSLFVLPTLPFMWVFATEPWMIIFPNAIGGAMWAAFSLANFQSLLELSPEDEREQYTAVFHTTMFAAFFLAPFLGGFLVDHIGYRAVFAISGSGRLIALALFLFAVGGPAREKLRARRPSVEAARAA